MSEFVKRFGLSGRKALVTGASKGIGAATCSVLADAGADIVAVGRDQAGLDEAKEAVERIGRRCLTIVADLGTVEGPRQACAQALKEWGTIDILVNNAGIARVFPALEHSVEDWDEVMAVNLRAPFLFAQALAPAMIAQRWGKIINVSSTAGKAAVLDHAAYCASKAGVNILGQCLTLEWAKHNIQVNAVCPTVTLTPMGRKVWGPPEKGDPQKAKIPMGRFLEPIEVADAILFLASDASNMITGETIVVDGGYLAA
ncbi:SDR family NAD(P)-dependent oxidoreductase [Geminicoccus flavidas]|uniref:SDR family NAD(P)-dependent oxidoreductase n=1 Tax=Geminicoccus flavidas TaxID=2506407 RepID=UPI00135C0E34|nr:SDR family oxidoreductase [Geminicoccus flavidas]